MKIFISYIKTNIMWIAFIVFLMLLQMAFMSLSGINKSDCLYGFLLDGFIFLILASIGFTRKTSSFTVSDYVVKTSLTNSISGGNVEIKEVQLNVSNLIGEYYLTFYGEATGTSSRAHASMNLYEIELV